MTIKAKINILKKERLRKGLSIKELGNITKLSSATIFKVENGASPNPSTAKKICNALNCTFDDLFEFAEECRREAKNVV